MHVNVRGLYKFLVSEVTLGFHFGPNLVPRFTNRLAVVVDNFNHHHVNTDLFEIDSRKDHRLGSLHVQREKIDGGESSIILAFGKHVSQDRIKGPTGNVDGRFSRVRFGVTDQTGVGHGIPIKRNRFVGGFVGRIAGGCQTHPVGVPAVGDGFLVVVGIALHQQSLLSQTQIKEPGVAFLPAIKSSDLDVGSYFGVVLEKRFVHNLVFVV